MKKFNRLIIIPAKSFSSRIKQKNFKKFLGKPIILYSYEAAKKSKIFNKIHVSTESNLIKKKLKELNISIDFLRDKKLTKQKVGIFEVYKQTLLKYNKLGIDFDEIWGLLPCSPLIVSKDLISIKKKIILNKIRLPLITVAKFPSPIEWAFEKYPNNKLKPLNIKKFELPSQRIKQKYFDVGNLCIFSKKNLIQNNAKSILSSYYGYELPREKSVDIDNIDDWNFAKLIKKGTIAEKN